jgi:hypothetical protein
VLVQTLRAVLDDHPGIAWLLKARAPLTPHSLAMAEALLTPLWAAGLRGEHAARAYHLIHDYTIGFARGDRTGAGEQRLQDADTRRRLRTFLSVSAHRPVSGSGHARSARVPRRS